MELREVVNMFKSVGAVCRKVRGLHQYVCRKGHVTAKIDSVIDAIEIESPGELRTEYLRTELSSVYGGISEEELLEHVRELAKADRVYIEIPTYEANLRIEYRGWRENPEKARKAVEIFKNLADKELWLAITNMEGELRVYKGEKPVHYEEWLKELLE